MNRFEHSNMTENEGPQSAMPGQTEIPHDDLMQIIWRRRWTVLISVVVCLVLAFFYLLRATPVYTSTSRLYVEQSGPKIINEQEGVMTQSKNYLYTQSELLKSTPILANTMEEVDIKKMKSFTDVDNPVGYLKKALDVKVGAKDDIISVSFDSPYNDEAARLVNSVVDSYVTYQSNKRRNTSGEVVKILQKEKVKRDEELASRLKTMMDFKLNNGDISFEGQKGNIIFERLAKLSEAMTTAQLETIDAKANYEATKAMMADPEKVKQLVEAQRAKGVFVSTANETTQLRADLNNLQVQLVSLKRQLSADHPAVKSTETKISEIKKRLAELDIKFADAQMSVASQQYEAAKQKEEQIAKYFAEQRAQATGLNAQMAEYTMLESAWEQTKKLSDILDERIKEINVTEDTGALNITILEVARPDNKPTSPQKTRIMAMALVLGLMLGFGLGLLQDWMDHRLRNAEEISATMGVPVLGVIPSMSDKETQVTRGTKVNLEPTSPIAEAYRTVRTAIYFGAPKDQARTILVTSPAPGDGKSTFASNLAIAMAQAGQRVLLIDADFRKPMQHNIFEIDQAHGLSSVLAGNEPLKKVLHHTKVDRLDVLPCGQIPPNPSEMLNSQAFGDVLGELSTQYDRVVIDSPPVMPVTDARILGAICDLTVVVLRAEKSTRKSAQQARDGLLSVGARILGAVVNAVPHGKDHYGYYSGYGAYGSYSYGYYGHSPGGNGDEGREKRKKIKAVPATGMEETA